MAEIVGKGGKAGRGAGAAVDAYSRVVACYTGIAPAVAVTYCYTGGVGQTLTLLNVQVETFIAERAPFPDLRFRVKRGFSRPQDIGEVRGWEDVVVVWFGDDVHGMPVPWRGCCWSWDMAVRYVGAGQRFGLLVENTSGEEGMIAATFKIAEY